MIVYSTFKLAILGRISYAVFKALPVFIAAYRLDKAVLAQFTDIPLDRPRIHKSLRIEVAKKIADALDVSLDYLAGEAAKAMDKQTLKLIQDIEELEPSIKEKLFFLANAVIRDSKTKKSLYAVKAESPAMPGFDHPIAFPRISLGISL